MRRLLARGVAGGRERVRCEGQTCVGLVGGLRLRGQKIGGIVEGGNGRWWEGGEGGQMSEVC
jgi:hypothetical protein